MGMGQSRYGLGHGSRRRWSADHLVGVCETPFQLE